MPTVDQLHAEYQQSPGYGKQSPNGFVEFLVARINALEAGPTERTLRNIRIVIAYARGMAESTAGGAGHLTEELAHALMQANFDLQALEWDLNPPKPAPQITACPFCGETAHPSGAEVLANRYAEE